MGDLSKLEGNVPVSPSTVPPILGSISTPLKWEAWATELDSHPDREYAQYIVAGIKQGFRIGFNYESHRCNSAKSNMFSAVQHPQPISRRTFPRKWQRVGLLALFLWMWRVST